MGFKLKGERPDGLFKTFQDKNNNIRIKNHPPYIKLNYSDIHIYDKKGNSLTSNLKIAPKNSPETHIKMMSIDKELKWKKK